MTKNTLYLRAWHALYAHLFLLIFVLFTFFCTMQAYAASEVRDGAGGVNGSSFTLSIASAEVAPTGVATVTSPKAPQTLQEGATDAAAVSRLVGTLAQKQEQILRDMEGEQEPLEQKLKPSLQALSALHQELQRDYNSLYLIYDFNRNGPVELSLLDEQLQRFYFQLHTLYMPLKDTQEYVDFRLQQVKKIVESVGVLPAAAVAPLLSRASKAQKVYEGFSTLLHTELTPAQHLLKNIQSTSAELDARMPSLWLDHYLHKNVVFFSSFPWQSYTTFFQGLPATLERTFLNEIPLGKHAWLSAGWNFLFITAALAVFLLALQRISLTFPPLFAHFWQQNILTSLPYIVLGIAFEYASWYGGNRYQVLSALGMLSLCFGQLRFFWSALHLGQELPQQESPYFSLVFLLGMTFILMMLMALPLVLTVLWILLLGGILWYERQKAPFLYPLLHYMRLGFRIILVVGIFLAVEGRVFLSALIVIAYTCLMVGIHQVQACLHVTTLVGESLPQQGIKALFCGLVLSLVVPLVLALALLSPFVWILSYPGGEYLIAIFSNFDVNIGKVSFNAVQALSIIIIFYLVKSVVSVSCNYIDTTWSLQNGASRSSISTLTTPIKTSIFFGLWGLFALYVLKVVGFSLTSLTVIAGGLSVGVGLGMQGIVQNTFSGFLLIFGQNIREGDVVVVGDTRGIVQKVSLRATKVRTFDNAIVFVPNSEFLAKSFINWTHNDRVMRNIVSVGVAYGSDLDLVHELIHKVLDANERVLKRPLPHVRFMGFGGSSLDFEIRFWVSNYIQHVEICSEVRYAINAAFREHGVEMPFLQTDVHIKDDAFERLARAAEGVWARRKDEQG